MVKKSCPLLVPSCGIWMTFPLADRMPMAAFPGLTGNGAGFMGISLFRAGRDCTGGVSADSTAGGPILLHVAARRAKGEGCVSWEAEAAGWRYSLGLTAAVAVMLTFVTVFSRGR